MRAHTPGTWRAVIDEEGCRLMAGRVTLMRGAAANLNAEVDIAHAARCANDHERLRDALVSLATAVRISSARDELGNEVDAAYAALAGMDRAAPSTVIES